MADSAKLAVDLDQRFIFLDALPESLFETVVTTRHGELPDRVSGILQWRVALLEGGLPTLATLCWPQGDIARQLMPRLDVLELPGLCAGQQSLTDHLLETLCLAVDSIAEWQDSGMLGLFDDVLEQTRKRRDTPSDLEPDKDDGEDGSEGGAGPGSTPAAGTAADGTGEASQSGQAGEIASGNNALPEPGGGQAVAVGGAAVRRDAGGTAVDQTAASEQPVFSEVLDGLQQQWRQLADNWRETEQVVSGMGTRLGRGWDLSLGRLRQQGWREFVALRRWIADHPELVAVVDSLGRDRSESTIDQRPDSADSNGNSSDQHHLTARAVPAITDAPTDTRGITRSDEIARMLPQEAAFLGHPLLKRLWHARRLEQGLLTYQVQGVMSEHRIEPQRAESAPRARKVVESSGKGPLMICVDTSASMHGEPEIMAKAVCLEVVRLANQQRRDCLLFTFSGPQQITEHRLAFSPGGLRGIIRFLQYSFVGGTDIAAPVQRALRRSREACWRRADLLLISDGRFPLPSGLAEQLSVARAETGLRVQGISVGRWSGHGMASICESLFRFETAAG